MLRIVQALCYEKGILNREFRFKFPHPAEPITHVIRAFELTERELKELIDATRDDIKPLVNVLFLYPYPDPRGFSSVQIEIDKERICTISLLPPESGWSREAQEEVVDAILAFCAEEQPVVCHTNLSLPFLPLTHQADIDAHLRTWLQEV